MSITNRDIYKNALSLIGERVSTQSASDYEERAEYILPAFFSIARSTDKKLRALEGKKEQEPFNSVRAPLDDEFPLLDHFVSAAALYLASILVVDEDQELSDSMYDKYCDSIASVAAWASCESIAQRYFYD